MTHLLPNLSLKRGWSFKKKNAKESLKVKLAFSAIKFVVEMHFKDEKEDAQQKVKALFSSLFDESKTHVALQRRHTLAILRHWTGTNCLA